MWKPIGTFDNPFFGHFDGCGYSISGMRIKNFNTSDGPQGLFGYVYVGKELNTSFENLKIDGSISTQNQLSEYPFNTDESKVNGIGGLVGNLSGIYNATFTNISSNVFISAEYAYNVGGIVGISHGGIFKQCQNNGTVSGHDNVGGLVGKACSIISYYRTSSNKVKTLVSITVGNCSNNGAVIKQEHGIAIGGIIGRIDSGYVKAHNEDNKSFTDEYESAQVSNSYNNGKLSCKKSTCVGGIVGWITSSLKDAIINNCFNSALVQGQTNMAGIVGSVESRKDARHNLSYNSNFGQCEAITAVGGIAGCVNNTVIIGWCYNNAKIVATKDKSGGIVGRMTMSDNSTANVEVGYCYNQGQVLSVEKIGGIIGEINYTANSSSKSTINLETCLNNGVVGGEIYENYCKYYAGGIVGFIDCTTSWLSITIKNCANKSQVNSFLVAGGIVGYYSSSGTNGTNTVKNCLNAAQVGTCCIVSHFVFL